MNKTLLLQFFELTNKREESRVSLLQISKNTIINYIAVVTVV